MIKQYIVTLSEMYFFTNQTEEEIIGVFDDYDVAKDFVEQYAYEDWEQHDHKTHDGRKFWCYDKHFEENSIEEGKLQFLIEEMHLNKPDVLIVKEILDRDD
jgi:hypothetical protein